MNPLSAHILDFFTLHQKQAGRVLLIGCGTAILCAVCGIVWYVLSPSEPPDPAASDIHTIAEYIKSDEFLEKPSLKRGEYTDRLVQRYHRMSDQEREAAQKEFGDLFQKNRSAEKTFWLSYMSKQADHYDKLLPEQKEKFLDHFLFMAETMHGQHRAREDYQQRGPLQRQSSPEQKKRAFYRMQKNMPLLLHQTTAEDRAKIAKLAGDMMTRMQQRYGER